MSSWRAHLSRLKQKEPVSSPEVLVVVKDGACGRTPAILYVKHVRLSPDGKSPDARTSSSVFISQKDLYTYRTIQCLKRS